MRGLLILLTIYPAGCLGPKVPITFIDKPDPPPGISPLSSLNTLSGRYALEGEDHFPNLRLKASAEDALWVADHNQPGGDTFVVAVREDRITFSIYAGDKLLRMKSLLQGQDYKPSDTGIEIDQTSQSSNGAIGNTIKYRSHMVLYRAQGGALIIRAHRDIDHVSFPPVPWKTDYTVDEWLEFPERR